MAGNKALHAVISGAVQGVNFRTFTARNARLLTLTGYVHNLDSGKVEVVAEGNEENLVKLLAKLRRGPEMAEVKSIDVSWLSPTGNYRGFRILYQL